MGAVGGDFSLRLVELERPYLMTTSSKRYFSRPL